MSSFYCEICGQAILDSSNGYTTECAHYPLEKKQKSTEELYQQFKNLGYNHIEARQLAFKAQELLDLRKIV